MNKPTEPTAGDNFGLNPGPENNLNSRISEQRRRIQFRAGRDTPIATYSLMGITILVFLLQQASILLLNGTDLPAVFGMKVNDLILGGQLWRLFTPMFLHGSILHLGFNMYALYIFGPGLERAYGHGRYLALYFLAGFAGNVSSFLFTDSPSLGSSTAIFGLLGAEGVFLYQNRRIYGTFGQRALINLVVIAVINLIIGLSPGIDNWGHVGGLLGGVLFAWYAGPVLRVEGIPPYHMLVDERPKREVWRAGVSIWLLFGLLAVTTMFLNIR
jgi:rhomboid protease GluP